MASKRSSSPLRQGRSLSPLPAANATTFGNWKSPLSLTARSGKTIPARTSPNSIGSAAAGLRDDGSDPARFNPSSLSWVPVFMSFVSFDNGTMTEAGIENMEKKSGFLDKPNKGKCRQMSDVALANDLVKSIGGGGRVGDFLHAAAKELKALFPHKGEPKKQWTERRLKSWWNNETDVVRHWQMMELYQAAEIVNDEQALLKQAKRKHAEFIEKTARLRALAQLAHQDDARG